MLFRTRKVHTIIVYGIVSIMEQDKKRNWALTLSLLPGQIARICYDRFILNKLGFNSIVSLGGQGLSICVSDFLTYSVTRRAFLLTLTVLETALFGVGVMFLFSYEATVFIQISVVVLCWFGISNTVWMIRHFSTTTSQFKAKYKTR